MPELKNSFAPINIFGIGTAIISFIGGTIILLLFYFTYDFLYVFIGYFYLFGAILFNFSVLILQTEGKKLITILIMMLNIPVVYYYYNFYDEIDRKVTINLINESGILLDDIILTNPTGKQKIKPLDIHENYPATTIMTEHEVYPFSIEYTKNDKRIKQIILNAPSFLNQDEHEFNYRIGIDSTIILKPDED